MPDGTPLEVEVKVNSDGAIRGLKIVSSSVTDAAELMRESLAKAAANAQASSAQMGKGFKSAGEETERAAEGMVQHIRGMRQEMFLGSFMSRQITELGAASKETAGLVAGLAGAFLVGNWTGLAVEGVLKLIGAFNEMSTEGDKFFRELNAHAHESFADIANKLEELREKMTAGEKGAVQETWQKIVDEKIKENQKIQEQIDALVRQEGGLGDVLKREFNAFDQTLMGSGTQLQRTLTIHLNTPAEEIRQLQQKIQENLNSIDANRPTKDALKGDEALEGFKEAADKRIFEDRRAAIEIMRLRNDLNTGSYKIAGEGAIRVAEIRLKFAEQEARQEQEIKKKYGDKADVSGVRKKLAADEEKEIAAVRLKTQQDVEVDLEAKDKQSEQKHAEHLNRVIAAEQKAAEAIKKLNEHLEQVREEEIKRLSEQSKKETEEQIQQAQRLGEAFGNVFSGLADGSMTFTKAFADMARTILKSIIDMEIKSIQSHALGAAAGAAESQSSIPIAGPVLAIGAMAAMEAAVLGLLSSLPSAAGGWELPTSIGNGGVLMVGHGGEKMLPADKSAKLDDMLEDGGGGGIHLHMHAAYIDASGVRDFVSSDAFTRGVREAQRNGRWPGSRG